MALRTRRFRQCTTPREEGLAAARFKRRFCDCMGGWKRQVFTGRLNPFAQRTELMLNESQTDMEGLLERQLDRDLLDRRRRWTSCLLQQFFS
jgi:hypothetical protein